MRRNRRALVVALVLAASALTVPAVRAGAVPAPPAQPGIAVSPLATSAGCMIQSNFGAGPPLFNPGNFEVVVLEGTELVHYWHPNGEPLLAWRRGQVITKTASGPGCIIQSTFTTPGSTHGNFEVVVREGSRLVHYYHDNGQGKENSPWVRGQTFGTGVTGQPAFIQSTLKAPGATLGNFEVVVPEGSNLVHYFHDNSSPTNPWGRGQTIATTATPSGGASLIQSTVKPNPTAPGNFEVLFQEGDHVAHYWHDNTNPANPWARVGTFGTGVTSAPSMIQSTFGTETGNPGNFEAVVRQGNNLVHWFKMNGPVGTPWTQGQTVATGVNSGGSLIQSNIVSPGGTRGNFELVVLKELATEQPGVVVEGGYTDYQLVHYFHNNASGSNPWTRAQNVTYRGRSEKICQLTGGIDVENFLPTTNDTKGRFGLGYTDLGYAVDSGTNLKLYFGDSRDSAGNFPPGANGHDDAVGSSTDTVAPTPAKCLTIDVPHVAASPPTFVPLTATRAPSNPSLLQGLFNVPESGFTTGSNEYTIFWTNHCTFQPGAPCPVGDADDPNDPNDSWDPDYLTQEGRATLTRNTSNTAFQELFRLPANFAYTASLNSANIAGLPAGQQLGVYVWGVPLYRGSYPRLAYVPAGQVEDRTAWRYLKALDANGGPIWDADPNVALRLFDSGDIRSKNKLTGLDNEGCIGEMSVSWVAPLQRWVMLYNCGRGDENSPEELQGVRARYAAAPWGPWSAPTDIFTVREDKAACRYMHAVSEGTCIDHADVGVGNNGRGEGNVGVNGDPYGPYVLSRFTKATPQGAEIYFVMSTWSPYQTVIMRTNLRLNP